MPSEHKRILLVDIGAPFGGVESYIDSLADLLKGQCALYAICALPQLANMLRQRQVHTICIPILFHRNAKIIRFFLCGPILIYMVLRYHINTVQFNGYLESCLIPLVRLLGRRAVRIAHGPTEIGRYTWYGSPISYFPRLGSLVCMRFASKVVCVSHSVSTNIAGYVNHPRLLTVSNWVRRPPVLKDCNELNSPPIVLFVGRLEEYKGLQILIEAAKTMQTAIRLIVVGDGGDMANFKELATGISCDFEGFQANTERYYSIADVFVNPSLGPEGLPIVSLEAMASGLPCIFSALPVHREISVDGQGAILAAVGDVTELRSALEHLLADADSRRTIVANAQEIIRQTYSPTAALSGYLDAFEIDVLPMG